ncbi:DeoR/GlpR family DNA-binding transcription regulator [Oleiagrimonas sp. C23AA]|uniref:DeoR/GlpR family DNA-binding transcription regulator n=1 Tax=Oleiagrimonas sp. C23AA TaxID=2719047 RepID=UPI0014202ED1|nr:DeoR/GlpR family DNA-binding transcription regulator [Oleiagrimonas sp. C23AA]NII10781.1 DeoR/GlpR transcriptional regulator [Oleiagrimonas sp. C23AA]
MWHEERYKRIRGLLKTFGQVSVERITSELGVSRETVRRDLLRLEARGEIQRVHGGAVLVGDEPPIDVRATTRVREKRAIARAVAGLVESGQTLFLDAGTTTTFVAEALASLHGLTVITNSVGVAAKLAATQERDHGNHVRLLGGSFNAELNSTYGAVTVAEIARHSVHVAILSPVGVDAVMGATSFLLDEAEVARAMSTHAHHTIIAADRSKIGVRSRVGYCAVDAIGTLVTDQGAGRSQAMKSLARSIGEVVYA